MSHLDPTIAAMMSALGWAVLKATVLLTLATLLTRLLQRRTAALRHLIWTVALGAIVCVLMLPVVLPAWRVIPSRAVSVDVITPHAVDVTPLRTGSLNPNLELASGKETATSAGQRPGHARNGIPASEHATATSRGASWPAVIVAVWLLGVVAVFVRYASSRVALLRLARRSTASAESGAVVRQISRQMRITRPVCLRTSDYVDMPFTWGVFRPQIVLPGDASEWSPDCRRHVLEHEFAHIRRFDAGTQLVAQAAATLFWFHPLVWYAVGRMRCERERACDDYVLANGAVACDYASDLLALVTNYGYVERHAAALAFARRSQFEGRLLALLDPTVARGMLSPRRVVLILSVSAAFVVPFAALESAEPPTAHAATQPVTQPTAIRTPPVALPPSTIAVRRPTTPVRPPVTPVVTLDPPVAEQSEVKDVFANCAVQIWNHQSDHSSSGDGTTVWTGSAWNDDCGFELKSEGDVFFNHDATAIERITPGGYFDVTTSIRSDVTRLIVRASATGALAYELTRNGQRTEFASAGSAWLEQMLIGLDRTTAFAIDRRFPVLVQAGADNVLAEAERMHTDHAKVVYLRRLIENVTLDAGALHRTADLVAGMARGHQAGEVVVAVTSKYALEDSATRAVFLRAALALESDNDQVRTFLGIIAGASLGGDEVAAILRAVARMSVDHEKSRVLLGLAATQRLDGELRTAYGMAAETIRDARVRQRALNGLVSR